MKIWMKVHENERYSSHFESPWFTMAPLSLSLSLKTPPASLLSVLEKIESNRILVVAMAYRSSDSIAFDLLSAYSVVSPVAEIASHIQT
jgi:hypothetical protein